MNISEKIKDAAIYVGTYHKYNCGSLYGKWMRLADYADKKEFYKACAELHKDESDPEFMFQDWEYIPDGMCGESWVSKKVWELFELDDDEIEIVTHYVNACSIDVEDYETIEELKDEAKECFMGYYESVEDLGRSMFEENILPYIDEHLRSTIENYFDCEDYGRSYTVDWYEEDGYYFDTQMR